MKSIIFAAFVAELASPIPAHAQRVDAGLATQSPSHSSSGAVQQTIQVLRHTLRLLSGAPATPPAPPHPHVPHPHVPPPHIPNPHGSHGASGPSRATAKVKGAVVFEVTVVQGDVNVNVGAKNSVTVAVTASRTGDVVIDKRGGNRMTARFGRSPALIEGDVTLTLPPGSSVVVQAVNGDVKVKRVGGDATVSAVSGDVEVQDANEVVIESVSGDVTLGEIRGPVRLETVSGDAKVTMVSKADARLRFETTSGDLTWKGLCGAGCRLRADSLSGDLNFIVDKRSSFDIALASFSGNLVSKVKLVISGSSGRLGKGAGSIECNTHSGDVIVSHGK